MDGGISFIEACELLDSQSDTVTRETTQSPAISCGESSSESVAVPASLNSQACSLPVSPVEPHMRSKDQLICARGNRVHRSSAKTRTEKNERIVAITPSYQYENTRLSTSSLKCFERLPWQLWRSRNTRAIVRLSQPRLQEQLLIRITHDGSSRKPVRTGWLLKSVWFVSFVWLKKSTR